MILTLCVVFLWPGSAHIRVLRLLEAFRWRFERLGLSCQSQQSFFSSRGIGRERRLTAPRRNRLGVAITFPLGPYPFSRLSLHESSADNCSNQLST